MKNKEKVHERSIGETIEDLKGEEIVRQYLT